MTATGAYGFRIEGVTGARGMLVEAPSHWPLLKLEARTASLAAPRNDHVDDGYALVSLRSGGWVELDRAGANATFYLPSPPDDSALIHPHLATAAIIAAHWLGRDSFHAGALVSGGGVWGVLGEKGDGKSSLLASLAIRGVPVMCDDLLVLDRASALAGPRSLDLRADAADRLGVGTSLGVIGQRERWRMPLDPVAPELPLRGWVALRWGDRVEVGPMRGTERLRLLLRQRGIRLAAPSPGRLLELSELPVLKLQRPRRWESSEQSLEALLAATSQ